MLSSGGGRGVYSDLTQVCTQTAHKHLSCKAKPAKPQACPDVITANAKWQDVKHTKLRVNVIKWRVKTMQFLFNARFCRWVFHDTQHRLWQSQQLINSMPCVSSTCLQLLHSTISVSWELYTEIHLGIHTRQWWSNISTQKLAVYFNE